MMVREPRVDMVAVNVAEPVPSSSAFPRFVVPSVKLTVPVGVAALETPVTVTLKTVVPFTDTVVGAAVTAVAVGATVIVTFFAVLVDALNVVSPLYTAVIECPEPPLRVRPSVQEPEASVQLPRVAVPSRNSAVPLGVPLAPVTVAVSVCVAP
jgi:hypothetical protein